MGNQAWYTQLPAALFFLFFLFILIEDTAGLLSLCQHPNKLSQVGCTRLAL